jgi:hypothetical protein
MRVEDGNLRRPKAHSALRIAHYLIFSRKMYAPPR